MGFLDKMKNLFTEEIEEEEVKPQKREVKPVEQPVTRRETTMQREFKTPLTESKTEENKEKFVFPVYFDDKDFDDLEKPKPKPSVVPKQEKKEEIKREPYQGAKVTIAPEPKKVFKPSPIISPVYGVLDKNYSKDDITTKQEKNKKILRTPSKPENMTIDDIRKKAYGTLEDDLEDTLAYDFSELEVKPKHSSSNKEALDIFNELDFNDIDEIDEIKENKFEELEKNIILEKQEKIIDDDTAELARQLEEQKKKLEEISKYISKNEVDMESVEKTEETIESVDEFEDTIELEKIEDTIEIEIPEETEKTDEQNLNDSELFDLIDSMYETKEDDE